MNEKIDTEKYNKVLKNAQRTLKILALIRKGLSILEIKNKVGCERQLVEYYVERLTK